MTDTQLITIMSFKKKCLILLTVLTILTLLTLAGTASAKPQMKFNVTVGGGGYQAAESITQSDNGMMIAGYRHSLWGDRDVWVAKLNENGNTQWTRTYGGRRDDSANSIIQLNDGYLLAGYTETLTAHNFWVAKITDSGSLEWSKSYERSNDDRAISAAETSNGYVIAGRTEGQQHTNTWVLSLHRNGSKRWSETYGEFANSPRSIITTQDGYVIAGYRKPEKTSPNLWLFKINNDGEEVWDRSTWSGHYEASDVIETDDGYALIGYTTRGNTDDFWFAKTDKEGEITDRKTYGTSEYEYGTSILEMPDNQYVLAGVRGFTDTDFWILGIDERTNKEWSSFVKAGTGGLLTDIISTDFGFAVAGYAGSDDDPLDARVVAFEFSDETKAELLNPDFQISPKEPSVGTEVVFNGSMREDGVIHLWRFGDGSTAAGRNTSHTYTFPGNYTVVHGVGTEDVSSTEKRTLQIKKNESFSEENQRTNESTTPEIEFTPQEPVVGEQVNFRVDRGNGSWSFGDGTTARGSTVTHQYQAPGTYRVQLTQNQTTVNTTIDVFRIESSRNIEINYRPENPVVEDKIVFNASSIPNANYTWRFGDGVTSHSQNTTHQYNESEEYTVHLTVNTTNRTMIGSVQITVEEEARLNEFDLIIGAVVLVMLGLFYTRFINPN